MSSVLSQCISFPLGIIAESSGTSNESNVIQENVLKIKDDLQQSFTGQGLQILLKELDKVFSECSVAKWDGYYAVPISSDAYEETIRFLKSLSPFIPPPEIVPEPDGELALEWSLSTNRFFIVGFKGDGIVTYSGLFATQKVYGKEHFIETLPQVITENICRLLYE